MELSKVKAVLLDIEGTICPIAFVKDTLFPYALKALPDVLAHKWDDQEFAKYRDEFPTEARESRQALEEHVCDLTARDVKIAYLKNLQGYLWRVGYESGEIVSPLFADVVPALRQWHASGIKLAVFSSGSVTAQKLLLQHVAIHGDDDDSRPNKLSNEGKGKRKTKENGGDDSTKEEDQDATTTTATKSKTISRSHDSSTSSPPSSSSSSEDLTHLFNNRFFDTVSAGPKTQKESYIKIAKDLGVECEEMLFLSDNVNETQAALDAGMMAKLVDRAGNVPVSDEDKEKFDMIYWFS